MIEPTGSGVALHRDMLVHAARGLIRVRDVREGEVVFALDEETAQIQPAVVAGVIPAGPAELLQVRVGSRVLMATPDTSVFALVDRRRPGRQRRRFRRERTRAAELESGDIVAIARKTPDLGSPQPMQPPGRRRDGRARQVTFPAIATEDVMWWAGLYVGDGYVHHSRNKKRIEFAIPASQADLRTELIAVTRALFGVEARGRDEWRVVVPGIRLVDFIEEIGLGGTALEKRIPEWVFASPEPHRLAFLGGYVDADGMVRAARASKDMGATSANRELLEDARRLAVTCGVRTTRVWTFTSRHPIERDRIMTGYRMQFSGDFDRIRCRAAQRRDRMHKRRFIHNNSAVGRTTMRSHTNEWIGFARVGSVASVGQEEAYVVKIVPSGGLVAETLIVRGG